MPTPSEVSENIRAWMMNPNRVYPANMTQEQKGMLFVVVGHGWAMEKNPDSFALTYKHKSGAVAKTVEEAYAMNQALIALER